jgi:acetyl esterase/lipase
MASAQMQNLINFLKDVSAKMDMTVEAIRKGLEHLGRTAKLATDVKYEQVNVGVVPAEWIISSNINHQNVILYFHAGYYIVGSIELERPFATQIGKSCNCRVLTINYR